MEERNTEMEKCFALDDGLRGYNCLKEVHKGCGTVKCPFFKPADKRAWIRSEKDGKVEFIEKARR